MRKQQKTRTERVADATEASARYYTATDMAAPIPEAGGYSRAELDAAFDLVKNGSHWKGRINRRFRCDADEVGCVEAAVVFFTGSVLEVDDLGGDLHHGRAAGYWSAVGA